MAMASGFEKVPKVTHITLQDLILGLVLCLNMFHHLT